MGDNYRNLTTDEIAQLEAAGCVSSDWGGVVVTDGFSTYYVRGCRFAGNVRIGANGGTLFSADGVERSAGIYNAEIIDCSIGDNVFIRNIGSYICRYDIGDNAYIENVGKITCTGDSSFGNGTEVATVNENRGRAIPIFDAMSAQTAYMMAMYRHRTAFIERIFSMVSSYVQGIDSRRGKIGSGAVVTGCNTISDVRIGASAVITGASVLDNGTVLSNAYSPTHIGAGVKARNFICSYGACMDNGAAIDRCFVGEACHIDYGFTAVDSLFFANCDMAGGEACFIFAAPYTVSHHKSSLLIAGYFSFFNAGSGANQSNHLFKTGAVHQGVHERGCKFGSNAYVMLPAREAAFTVILGRHQSHHDTSDFPFSYLLEDEGKSYLLPGKNLKSYGTLRDIAKWPIRDARGDIRIDRINYDEYNPYIGTKLVRAIDAGSRLLAKQGTEVYTYRRVKIKASALSRGVRLYELALSALMGHILEQGYKEQVVADELWVDMAGMFASWRDVESLMTDVETGRIDTITEIEARLNVMVSRYDDAAYAWAIDLLNRQLGREPAQDDIAAAIAAGREAAERLHAMRTEDALRDEGELMATSYGIDALSTDDIMADFAAVRNIK
jgi:hypothetical protein